MSPELRVRTALRWGWASRPAGPEDQSGTCAQTLGLTTGDTDHSEMLVPDGNLLVVAPLPGRFGRPAVSIGTIIYCP